MSNLTSSDKMSAKTNRGNTLVIAAYYTKEEPEGLWEDVFDALKYIGIFENLTTSTFKTVSHSEK